MAPERLSHALAKGTVYRRLVEGSRRRPFPARSFRTAWKSRWMPGRCSSPLLRCGDALPGDTIKGLDPLLVVEVLSPSTSGVDATRKLIGYFRIPSLHHYLLVDADRLVLVHHRRAEDGEIVTRILPPGPLRLDPPGVGFDPFG